jgi:hypothetical protein
MTKLEKFIVNSNRFSLNKMMISVIFNLFEHNFSKIFDISI